MSNQSGAQVDFRGEVLRIGDIVAASMGGRYHELQARVVHKLNPKTVTMIQLEAIEAFENEFECDVVDAHELAEVIKSDYCNWRSNGYRSYRMVAKVSSLQERHDEKLRKRGVRRATDEE